MLAAGRDPSFVGVALDSAEFVRRGGAAVLTGDGELLIGRPPRSFRNCADDHRWAFRWTTEMAVRSGITHARRPTGDNLNPAVADDAVNSEHPISGVSGALPAA
jgi:hypothetical protein